MERMKDDNGGAQTVVTSKCFLHVNNFRYADVLYVQVYAVW